MTRLLTPLVAALPATVPFVGPEAQERDRGTPFAARLGANESGFGPSPAALAAMRESAPDAWMYPDPAAHDLRAALAAHLGCGAENLVVGAGIDGLLNSVVRLTVGPATPVVTSEGAYPTFNYHVAGYGGALHKVPYRDDREDPDALAEAARTAGARLVYLANPDNPMGTWHPPGTIARMLDALPGDCLLLLDEAYLGCDSDFEPPRLEVDDPRILRLRTFSKAHGLAGLRIGYAVGTAELIGAFDKVRNHFGVSRMAQAAALASLRDADHPRDVQARIAASKARIASIAREAGLTALPSVTNFVPVDCGDADRARAVMWGLLDRGVFVRMPAVAPLNRTVRITCGPEAEMEVLARALPDAAARASKS